MPYVFGGVAGFHHSPQGKDASGNYVDLQALKTEGVSYSKFQFSIPFGAGVRYRINRQLDASFEIGFRKTFTGYLDDVSGNYADLASSTPTAQYFGGYGGSNTPGGITNTSTGRAGGFIPGAKRGQGKTDWYTVTGFSLNYILNPKIKNPKFR